MTSSSKTVAITGANGFVGTALVNHFVSQGWNVIALVRKPPKQLKENVIYRDYDILKQPDKNLLKDVDYLVHLAFVKQDRQHPEAFSDNVEAAKSLVRLAKKEGVQKSLFMSSMSAHEDAISAYGRQKLAIEKIFDGSHFVSIRSGLIIGNGGIVKQMVGFMRSKHTVPLVGGGKQPLQIVALDDLVTVIDKLLVSKLFGTYTVATSEVYSYRQLYETISYKLKIKVLFVPVPFFVLINGLRLINLLPIPLSISPDNALGLKQLKAAETTGDLKKIGVKLRSLEAALNDADI